MSTRPEPPDDAAPFLMTPAQHRERAEEMLELGRPDLARQHLNLARLIERRRWRAQSVNDVRVNTPFLLAMVGPTPTPANTINDH
jgi:lysophospholipase L1-like esterase